MEKMVNNRPQMSAPVKLPSLELPVFDGNILAFQEFSDLFTATIDSNKSLSPVQKLAYLRRYLTGKPLELVNGMKVCDANYTVAMDLLKSRYGNMQTIIEAHYTAIMDIPPCSPQTESLRSCINSLEVHLRSLEAAGETVCLIRKLPVHAPFQLGTPCLRDLTRLSVFTVRRSTTLMNVRSSKRLTNERRSWAQSATSASEPGMG